MSNEEDLDYAWQINDASLEIVFRKNLSKLSVGVYMRMRAVSNPSGPARPAFEALVLEIQPFEPLENYNQWRQAGVWKETSTRA
jgi:hypothetical protein